MAHFILINIVTALNGTHFYLRARSDGHVFFSKEPLSQKLWQIICVHSQQRQVLKKLGYRIFVNVSLFVLKALQKKLGYRIFVNVSLFVLKALQKKLGYRIFVNVSLFVLKALQKKLGYRIFVNVSLFVLKALQKAEGIHHIQHL